PWAFFYDGTGMLPLGNDTLPQGINAAGQIVGYSRLLMPAAGLLITPSIPRSYRSWNPSGKFHAFLYDDTGLHDLGTLPGTDESYANGINSLGQVVGQSGGRPFLYRAGVWQD